MNNTLILKNIAKVNAFVVSGLLVSLIAIKLIMWAQVADSAVAFLAGLMYLLSSFLVYLQGKNIKSNETMIIGILGLTMSSLVFISIMF